MGSTSDKIKGVADQAIGSVKKGVGNVTGSEELQVKGEAQKIIG